MKKYSCPKCGLNLRITKLEGKLLCRNCWEYIPEEKAIFE